MSTVQKPVRQTPFIIRAIWFFLIGWHVTAFWIAIAWLLNVTILGLPLGLWMINRVPQILTLRSTGGSFIVDEKSGAMQRQKQPQAFILLRAAYFLLIGWWFSFIWAGIGYLLCLTVIGLPFGLVMLNRLPYFTTLHRS